MKDGDSRLSFLEIRRYSLLVTKEETNAYESKDDIDS